MYQVHTAAERADLRAAWRGAGAAALRCAFIWCAKNALFESHVNIIIIYLSLYYDNYIFIYIIIIIFYQDRLGTDMGKVENKRGVF